MAVLLAGLDHRAVRDATHPDRSVGLLSPHRSRKERAQARVAEAGLDVQAHAAELPSSRRLAKKRSTLCMAPVSTGCNTRGSRRRRGSAISASSEAALLCGDRGRGVRRARDGEGSRAAAARWPAWRTLRPRLRLLAARERVCLGPARAGEAAGGDQGSGTAAPSARDRIALTGVSIVRGRDPLSWRWLSLSSLQCQEGCRSGRAVAVRRARSRTVSCRRRPPPTPR